MLKIRERWNTLVQGLGRLLPETLIPVLEGGPRAEEERERQLVLKVVNAVMSAHHPGDCDDVQCRCVSLGITDIITEADKDRLRQQVIDYKIKGLKP